MGRRDGKRSNSRRKNRDENAFMAEDDNEPGIKFDPNGEDTAAEAKDGGDAPAADAGGDAKEEKKEEEVAAPYDYAEAEQDAKEEDQAEEIADVLDKTPEDFDADDEEVDNVKAQRYAERVANKAGAKTRVKMYKCCNMFETAGAMLLKYALDNPMEKDNALGRRSELLSALYYLRHISDVDDDFAIEEFENEMKNIKIFRSKMARLAQKEEEFVDSDDEESSDDEMDEADDMDVLKEARKMMEFQFGKSAKDPGYRKREKWGQS